MAKQLFNQLENSGAEVIKGRALSVMPFGGSFGVAVGNDYYQAGAVIIAAGITREKLYPGEAEFLGRASATAPPVTGCYTGANVSPS